jgi:hypothetical protein
MAQSGLNWSVVEGMPHAHLSGGRVVRVRKDYQGQILEILSTDRWASLFFTMVSDDLTADQAAQRCQNYAEYLFLGNS